MDSPIRPHGTWHHTTPLVRRFRAASRRPERLSTTRDLPFATHVRGRRIQTAATDARVAVVAVRSHWPSARGLSVSNIAGQLESTTAALTRSIARFKAMAGLDSDGGVRPGAGSSNGDKPAVRLGIFEGCRRRGDPSMLAAACRRLFNPSPSVGAVVSDQSSDTFDDRLPFQIIESCSRPLGSTRVYPQTL